jgi:predicted AAA+ superfamily ATPase
MYIHRHAEKLLKTYRDIFPCVAITGPRQSGKSTMVGRLLPEVPYVSFDDPDEELAFRTDPKGFLARFSGQVIFDEVQRVGELFRYIKMAVDAEPDKKGRFILTGSNQLTLRKEISESLAGRIGLLSLLPFEYGEMPEATRGDHLLYGGYPALATTSNFGAKDWFASYVSTYLEKDVRLVFDIGKLVDFQSLLRLLAARTAQEYNASALSREIGVSSNTVDSWVSVLEAGYIVFRLQPFHANLGKRLIKRPKIYFYDTGLTCYLTGIRDRESLEGGPLGGPLFENFVIADLIKRSHHGGEDKVFFFYRDNTGNEIDLIIQDNDSHEMTFIEIKSGFTAKPAWAEQLEKTASLIQQGIGGSGAAFKRVVIYRGETKRNWPKAGIDFVNYEEALL